MPIPFCKFEGHRLALIPVAIMMISIIVWFATRATLPATLRIATAQEGGLYHEFGEALEKSLEERTGREVVLVVTEGSLENARLLREGKVDLALVQGGAGSLEGLAVIAPLYPEVVHVVTRSGSPLRSPQRPQIAPRGGG